MKDCSVNCKSQSARGLVLCVVLLMAIDLAAPAAAEDSCSNLASLALPNTTVATAASVTGGSFTPPGLSTPITNLPDFCRVAAFATPTSDSHIQFEVWIPESGWNGKYLQAGCGGFCGNIGYSVMAEPLRRGYAVAATDDGHEASGIDASWAVGHPQKIIDFAYRSLKVTTDNAKAIITAFESSRPRRSYFFGCSDGGREALMEAHRYSRDFDGIIVGSPANAWTHLMTGFVWDELALTETPDSALTQSDLNILSAAVLAKCAGHDGGLAADQFLNNPPACHFNPETLLCTGNRISNCLSQGKVTAISKLYSGPSSVFPGYVGNEGTEAEFVDWPLWITGNGTPTMNLQEFFGNSFFANMVFPNSGWTPATKTIAQDVRAADETMSVLNSNGPDLNPFRASGGKMIQYAGWSDSAISPQYDIVYYQSVSHAMGGLAETQEFYRLFMAPGMAHCAGGPGANAFGNIFGLNGPNPSDPSDDVLSALDQWVEQGIAPQQIIATKYVNDNPASGIAFQRPLCAFPQIAEYSGSGDPTNAANWVCVGGVEKETD
jgi:hypothetical protein